MKHRLLLAAFALLPFCGTAFAENVNTDYVHTDARFLRDYYAPPPDWVPASWISRYTANTRVPEMVWVLHKGSKGPGLLIKPIEKKWLEKEIQVGLIHPSKSMDRNAILTFDPAREKNVNTRTVCIEKLSEEADFTSFSFKVKAELKNADADLIIKTNVGTFKTKDCKDVKKEENGVTAYTFPMKPVNGNLQYMHIEVSPIQADSKQEITIFDMFFQREKVHSFVKEPEPRHFITVKDNKKVESVMDYIAANPANSLALPVKGWTAIQGEKGNPDSSLVKMETIKTELGDALKVTFTAGKKATSIRVPFKVNALEYNTLSFLYKLETPKEGLHCEGLTLNRIPQYFMFDKYVDNPGISFASAEDRYNWNLDNVTRTHLSQGRRPEAKTPAGWKAFAFDMVNDDPTGNKGFTYDKITEYAITFKNNTIPEGKTVTFIIAQPKVTKGLFFTGGNMKRYAEFREWKKNYKTDLTSDLKKYLGPKKAGRLAEPVPVMKNRIQNMEIVVTNLECENIETRWHAANLLKNYFTKVLQPANEIPIVYNQIRKNDNIKIVLGSPMYWASKEVREQAGKDIQAIGDTPGYAIRRDGNVFYIYGGFFNHFKMDKGIMNGALDFLEYNTDLIFAAPEDPKNEKFVEAVYTPNTSGDYSLVWGDKVCHKPVLKKWGLSNGNDTYSYLNRTNYFGCWITENTYKFAADRSPSANHWFGWGGVNRLPNGQFDQSAWGIKNGKPYRPDCYTGTPCLVKIMEAGKEDFAEEDFKFTDHRKNNPFYYRFNTDSRACWIEDTWQTCECELCHMPVRLPNGELITDKDPDFQAENHIVNATAYNQMTRVYANRNMELNYLIYFYTLTVPRLPLTKYLRAHFCPYVRSDYYEPIFAPVNDKFWRLIVRWGQVAKTMGVSDYFLGGWFRPGADMVKLDIAAMETVGLAFYGQETETKNASTMETWTMRRVIWDQTLSVDDARNYYFARAYREGAEHMRNFYGKLRLLKYGENRAVDFEDWAELGFLALKTPATKGFLGSRYNNLAEELTADLEKAVKAVKHPGAKILIENVQSDWKKYLENAQKKI